MSLLLNFSPIEVEDVEIEVGLIPYGLDGQQKLKQLRQKHWSTHIFRRDGADQIAAVPFTADALLLGDRKKKFRPKDNLGLTSLPEDACYSDAAVAC